MSKLIKVLMVSVISVFTFYIFIQCKKQHEDAKVLYPAQKKNCK